MIAKFFIITTFVICMFAMAYQTSVIQEQSKIIHEMLKDASCKQSLEQVKPDYETPTVTGN